MYVNKNKRRRAALLKSIDDFIQCEVELFTDVQNAVVPGTWME